MTRNAENINMKISSIGQQERVPYDFRIITLDKIYDWIDKKDYDDSIKIELKKMAAKYPANAYSQFGKNFQKHLSRAQTAARKNRPLFVGELGDDNYKRIKSFDKDFAEPEKNASSIVTDVLNKNKNIEMDMSKNEFDDDVVEKLNEKTDIIKNDAPSQECCSSQSCSTESKTVQKNTDSVVDLHDPVIPKIPYGLKQLSEE